MKLRALFLAINLVAAMSALAAETQLVDQTEFRVRTASGQIEKVKVANLAVGEVRNLTTEAGTPVVVGRHEGGYVIDVAGERIEVDIGAGAEIETELLNHEAHDGHHGKRIVRIHKDHEAGDGKSTEKRKVVVMHHGEGEPGDLEDIDVMVDGLTIGDGGVPEGKRVVVVRKIEKRAGDEAQ